MILVARSAFGFRTRKAGMTRGSSFGFSEGGTIGGESPFLGPRSFPRSKILGPRSVAEASRGFANVRELSANSGNFDFDGLSIFWCFNQLGMSP